MNEFLPANRLRGVEKSPIRQLFDRAPPRSINLGLGEPDLETPEVIKREAARVIAEEHNGYTTHAGLLQLREHVAVADERKNITPDHVIITAGSQEALYLVLLTMVDHGDEVLLPDPGFVAYPTIVRIAGGVPKFYRMPAANKFGFDREGFRRALSQSTKVVVCISPSNPTGRSLTNADLQSMAVALRDTDAYVISDEIYRELYFSEERPASISSFHDRTIVISGLSKSMSMTGWRLGWICGDAAVIRNALILHGYVTTCASTISQKAALVAWTEEAAESRKETRQTFRTRRDHLLSLLHREAKLEAVVPDGAFYTMVNVGHYGSSWKVCEAMLEHGVITVPGAAFGNESKGFLRVSFCADLSTLSEGVERMRAALTSLV